MEGDLLSGSGQYSLLILALACVTYIRSVPYPNLMTALKTKDTKVKTGEEAVTDLEKEEEVIKKIARQLITLDVMQLFFVAIGVFILGREILWGSLFDLLILWIYFVLVCVFMIFHLKVNIDGILKAKERLSK